jgi:lambda repressor-like predicted transcriptional regulator
MKPQQIHYRQAVWMRIRDRDVFLALVDANGRSLKGLAIEAGCSHQMVSALARGEKSCGPVLAHSIAAVLGVRVDVIFQVKTARIPRRLTSPPSQNKAAA